MERDNNGPLHISIYMWKGNIIMLDMLTMFNQFKQNFERQYPGTSPKDMVKRLLRSGQMSKEQFDNYSNLANMLLGGKDNK